MAEQRNTRRFADVSVEEMVRVNDEIQELIAEQLPRAFPVDVDWRLVVAGMLARIASILDGITALVERGRRAEAEVALRTLFEHVTLLCWMGIDPPKHMRMWQDHS